MVGIQNEYEKIIGLGLIWPSLVFHSEDQKKNAEQKREPLAEEHTEEKQAKVRPPPEEASSSSFKKARTLTTPPTLKQLLPKQGIRASEVWILRNPKTYGYQIRYPTGCLKQRTNYYFIFPTMDSGFSIDGWSIAMQNRYILYTQSKSCWYKKVQNYSMLINPTRP